jgi:ribosomal protein S18 acetylase RimI-like enzyme
MNVRRATESDLDTVRELWIEFERELPEPSHADLDVEREFAEIAEIVRDEIALLAEEGGAPIGFALARRRGSRLGRLTDLYVVPEARRRGVAAALVREVVARLGERGLEFVDLEVTAANGPARSIYARWGFREDLLVLVAPIDEVRARLGPEAGTGRPSFGSIHVQSDDVPAVERAVRQFVPRLPGGSRGSIVSQPRNGWVAVYDDVCDRDPKLLRRLARELSDRMGSVVLAIGVEEDAVVGFVLHERGGVVDEYLSVQEYYGPLPPGDVIALQANPRVVARLTGADPAAVRAAALHARSPADLPPPEEILAGLARSMGIEGADHGWAGAPELSDAVRIERQR